MTTIALSLIVGLIVFFGWKKRYDELAKDYNELFYNHWNPKAKELLESMISENHMNNFEDELVSFYSKGMLTKEEYEKYMGYIVRK